MYLADILRCVKYCAQREIHCGFKKKIQHTIGKEIERLPKSKWQVNYNVFISETLCKIFKLIFESLFAVPVWNNLQETHKHKMKGVKCICSLQLAFKEI